MAADYKAIKYEKEGRIAIFTMNRPEKLNALNWQMRSELYEAMMDFRDDPDLWVGIVTGAGARAFSAGWDIGEIKLEGDWKGAKEEPPSITRYLQIWKPLIAAINGWCLGGGLEVAISCDIRIATEESQFRFAELSRGWFPGSWGGTARISRLIPFCKAMELLIVPRPMDAREAYRVGLLNALVPTLDQLMSTAREWADLICESAPLAVRGAKEALVRGYEKSVEDALRLGRELSTPLNNTEDRAEGARAFLEKRKPVWKAK